VYQEQTLPIEEYYAKQGKKREINGELDPDSVLKSILNILQKEKR
jgi:adenylate kinase family enzyme